MLVLLNGSLSKPEKKTCSREFVETSEVYFHGGVSFDPYREQYRRLLEP
jgi:hypothetical protein